MNKFPRNARVLIVCFSFNPWEADQCHILFVLREIHSFINSTNIWVLSVCQVLLFCWLCSGEGCSSLISWSSYPHRWGPWCSGVYGGPIFCTKQELECLLVLNGAKSRWTHSGREGRSAPWWGERISGQEWSGHGSALGLLMSSESGSGVLKVILYDSL